MVWWGLQCKAPIAFPAQLFHKPWRIQVAVMTEDARLVALHSLDTVAPMVAPKPARPLTKATIWRPDIWIFPIFLRFLFMVRNKNCCRLSNYTVDMCFTVMIYRRKIMHGGDGGVSQQRRTGRASWLLVIKSHPVASKVPSVWSKNKDKYCINA